MHQLERTATPAVVFLNTDWDFNFGTEKRYVGKVLIILRDF